MCRSQNQEERATHPRSVFVCFMLPSASEFASSSSPAPNTSRSKSMASQSMISTACTLSLSSVACPCGIPSQRCAPLLPIQYKISTIYRSSILLSYLIFAANTYQMGIQPTKQEITDFIALFRYISYLTGTPDHYFSTPSKAKAVMETMFLYELDPSKTSKMLAHNFIKWLEDEPPVYLRYVSWSIVLARIHFWRSQRTSGPFHSSRRISLKENVPGDLGHSQNSKPEMNCCPFCWIVFFEFEHYSGVKGYYRSLC